MTITGDRYKLLFPCDCVSARGENYSDPWAPISRNKLFTDGTKEEIVNLVAESPKTISQLARALKLSVPSVHKHVNEMVSSELLRDSVEWEKAHPKERYYEPNFPVVSSENGTGIAEVCDELSDLIADAFDKALPRFEHVFQTTTLSQKGRTLDDLSQWLFARVQRDARRKLEERGTVLPAQPHSNGIAWSFWAEQVKSQNGGEPPPR